MVVKSGSALDAEDSRSFVALSYAEASVCSGVLLRMTTAGPPVFRENGVVSSNDAHKGLCYG